jgi:wyosine [tRNA(Phe)-imidazoG37] synthetase (radical SAM superfamily)
MRYFGNYKEGTNIMGNNNLITFGPVPSRRLGHSLGVNNIPPKLCSYSCVYCQLGRTLNMQIERKSFYKQEEILKSVEGRIKGAENKKEHIDYLTFVPDGEPTLDANLGKEIRLLKQFGIKIAVISNASLIWQKEVRNDLLNADWVSLKVDAITENIWHRINRPYRSLKIDRILTGISEFSRVFKGETATESMLIQGINDSSEEIKKIADFISGLGKTRSYISIPTRPPAEKWVKSADENSINTAYQIFKDKSINVEYLIGYEGNAFAFTGNAEKDLLSITAVHPMREEAVEEFLRKAKAGKSVIEKLLNEKMLVETEYDGNKFYLRKFK